jgi:CheY-like chemotaxis protein
MGHLSLEAINQPRLALPLAARQTGDMSFIPTRAARFRICQYDRIVRPGNYSDRVFHLLVADDNPEIRKRLCEILEREVDYDMCVEATHGEEAIALARRHQPALMVLDRSMPMMNGLEVARELKRIMPETPIILFTLYADVARKSGAVLFVDMVIAKTDRNLMSYIRSLVPADKPSI